MSGRAAAGARKPRTALAVVSGAIVFVILIGLGTWQVQRLYWKEGLIATIDSRMAEPPVDLLAALKADPNVADQEYRPVTVAGTFDHRFERHFFSTFKGQSGFDIFTPLKLDDGDWVFVDRGFVPYERKDASTRQQGQIAGRVTVTGLLRHALAEKPSSLIPNDEPDKNIFYWKDLRGMTASSGLPADAHVLDLFVDADAAPNPGGLPVGGTTIIDLPNNHLQYAITWYGLAAALAGVLISWLLRQRKAA
ncbi:MAG: SURF1 family protein [Mesorhizobium sp.]|nr:SURF1 family protein [Mesorhizobium sp.]MBN9241402.1 SURF1 family protein [Mesorhizobium sp.]